MEAIHEITYLFSGWPRSMRRRFMDVVMERVTPPDLLATLVSQMTIRTDGCVEEEELARATTLLDTLGTDEEKNGLCTELEGVDVVVLNEFYAKIALVRRD